AKNSYNMHTGHIVIDKPNYEYSLRPSAGHCSIFNFTESFYRYFIDDLNLKHSFFFSNDNLLSLLLKSTPETDYLHYRVLKKAGHAGKLEMDNLVLEILKQIVASFTELSIDKKLNASYKKFHLATIERAREYINDNFSNDISLHEISSYACVSPFHFSRIFKEFTTYSPHQYLLNVRLKHSEMLLKNTSIPVAQVSLASGFNSAEHFATAFKQKYKMNPSQYRNGIQGQ
ncbi:MAG: AraC family transcriptional regulator, partial [Chitinophagaceae bacterium]